MPFYLLFRSLFLLSLSLSLSPALSFPPPLRISASYLSHCVSPCLPLPSLSHSQLPEWARNWYLSLRMEGRWRGGDNERKFSRLIVTLQQPGNQLPALIYSFSLKISMRSQNIKCMTPNICNEPMTKVRASCCMRPW